MKDSIYQEKINEVYDNTNKNIFINASAGSGKTRTLLNLCKRTPLNKKICFLAFNKSIKQEAEQKLPERVDVSTLHSKGLGILRYNLKMNVRINEMKNFIYCKNILKGKKFKNIKKQNAYYFTISEIIKYVKMNLTPHTSEKIMEICNENGIIAGSEQIFDTIKVLNQIEKEEENLNTSRIKNIDFVDMLYLTVTKIDSEYYPKYDVVMIDECQDLNIAQQKMVLNLIKKNGRLIAVGDNKQAIYGFAGASLDTFNVFKNKENTEVLQLPMTYRCGKKIVDFANEYFPESTIAYEENSNGRISNGSILNAKDGDLIICRNNKPLIKAWIKIVSQEQKAIILGKDFGSSLKRILSEIETIYDLDNILSEKINELYDMGIVVPQKNKGFLALKEKCEIIEMLYNEVGSIDKIYNIIDDIFNDEKSKGVTLSTIHKAKGLEAERCFILNWGLIPSEYAASDKELYAEKCLQYVAITRAKKELIFIEINV